MRDPRTTPAAGDVLRKGNATLTITGLIHPNWVFWLDSNEPGEHRAFVGAWRRWAKDAEVLTVGGGA